jgi:hypothetical protein
MADGFMQRVHIVVNMGIFAFYTSIDLDLPVQLRRFVFEYSCAVTPPIRQTGNRLSGIAGTAYASLLA